MRGYQLPAVAVVVSARDEERNIRDCLESLLAQDYPRNRLELIVVDNRSRDATGAIARRLGVRCVRESRAGVSNARNRGAAETSGEILAFVDGDCTAADTIWLRELVAPLTDPTVGAVAGEMASAAPRTPAQRYMGNLLGRWQRFAVSADPPFAVAANLAVRRTAFERIGGFDPLFRRAQDVDFGWRFARTGLRIAFAENAVVRHRHRASALGVMRQQFGWAYGMGLLAIRHSGAAGDHRLPPLRDPLLAATGLLLVAIGRARGRRPQEHLDFAAFELARKGGWWWGALAGRLAAAAVRVRRVARRAA